MPKLQMGVGKIPQYSLGMKSRSHACLVLMSRGRTGRVAAPYDARVTYILPRVLQDQCPSFGEHRCRGGDESGFPSARVLVIDPAARASLAYL